MFFLISLILSIFYKFPFFDISIINYNFYYFNLIEKSTSLLLNKFIFLPYYISDRQCNVSNFYKIEDLRRAARLVSDLYKNYNDRFRDDSGGLIPIFSSDQAWHIVWGHMKVPDWFPKWLGAGKFLYYPKWLPFIGGKPMLFPRGIRYGFYALDRVVFLEHFPLYTDEEVLIVKYLVNTNYRQTTYMFNYIYVQTVIRFNGDIKSEYIFNIERGWSFVEHECMLDSYKYKFFNNRNRLISILTEMYKYKNIEKDVLTFSSICLGYIKSVIIIFVKIFL